MDIKRLAEQLSIKHGCYYSEEKLFEIIEEPDCAYLQLALIKDDVDNIVEAVKDYENSDTMEDWEDFHGVVSHEVFGTNETIVDLDNELDAIYEWGQGWKDLALRLIEENNIPLSDYTTIIPSEDE